MLRTGGAAAGGGGPGRPSRVFPASGRLKSHTSKLRYQTTKIMSGLKAGPAFSVNPVKQYREHRDGVWEVAASRLGLPVLATASADQTARVWGMHSGACLLQALNTNNQTQNCIQYFLSLFIILLKIIFLTTPAP